MITFSFPSHLTNFLHSFPYFQKDKILIGIGMKIIFFNEIIALKHQTSNQTRSMKIQGQFRKLILCGLRRRKICCSFNFIIIEPKQKDDEEFVSLKKSLKCIIKLHPIFSSIAYCKSNYKRKKKSVQKFQGKFYH